MPPYFRRIDETRFAATEATEGAWNTTEQHVAPALGLLTHALERDHASRHATPLTLSRASFDILGTMPIDEVEIEMRVVRPGRTIELAEATLSHGGRPAVIARAWFAFDVDTARIAGTGLPTLAPIETFEPVSATQNWPGAFVTTVEIRRDEVEPGRGRFWLRPTVPLLEGEAVSPTARLLGVADIGNGLTPRSSPREVHFPNVELTAHLFRPPATDWLGFDTTVSFGPGGHGLTHSILHDEHGPLGSLAQSLTVRPR